MASPAQILANRANAQRSSGPKTAEGKQASSRNATRHGLTGAQIVMPGEDPTAYEELQRELHRSYAPANDLERLLVDQIAANSWRLIRAQRIETAFLSKLAEGAENPDAAIVAALLEKPADLDRIQRYVSAAQNAFYKALRELEKLQKARATAEHHAALIESWQEPIGFVSHNPPQPVAKPALRPAVVSRTQKSETGQEGNGRSGDQPEHVEEGRLTLKDVRL